MFDTSPLLDFCRVFFTLAFVPAFVAANEAVLSENYQLNIPQLRFQGKSSDQFLWATLQYLPNQDGKLLFEVKDFGVLGNNVIPSIQPLASISDQGSPQVTTLNSNSAVLTFKASTPLACSVVYGITRQLGAIATDPAMNGGALTEHHPIMFGLKPDSDYFYRLQGTAANGVLYVGETGSFHTPAATVTARVNLAALENGAKVTGVSSNFGGVSNDKTWGANSAIDGSSATAWSSNGDGNDAFIEISLTKATTIQSVEVWSRSMSDGSAKILRFTITVDSGQVFGPFTLDNTDKPFSFAVDANTQRVRLDVLESTGGNTGLVEFGVY